MKFDQWLEKNSYCASYTHFDYKISLKDIIDDVKNPDWICKHAFKPFVHFEKVTKKFNGKDRIPKIRQLNYASHYDRCIYQYYAYLLNEKYNEKAKELKINNVAIAYRDILKKSNVHFAKQAFDFIKSHNDCVVIIADFTNFFDTLSHKYLKMQLCKLLDVEKLTEDYYKVFKNITRYSYVEKEEIDELCKALKIEQNKRILMPIKVLRENSKYIKQNKNEYGVPQGVAISSILSNIYMIEFDKNCQEMMRKMGGLYLRYSDDSIFVFPKKKKIDAKWLYSQITSEIKKIPNLVLSPNKTRVYFCDKRLVENCDIEIGNKQNSKNEIDYLGFSYDGKTIKIREKTISKYYYRAYKKAKTIVWQRKYLGKRVGTTNLYKIYTKKGSKEDDGNFLTYAEKCLRVFGRKEHVNRVLNVHYGKIKRQLKKKKSKQ